MRIENQLIFMAFTMIILAFTLPFAFPLANVPNPINDFTSALGIQVPGITPQSGAINGATSDTIKSQQASNAGCAASVIGGATVGGIVGAFGVVTIPIGIVGGAIVGGITGCLLLPAAAPSVSQNFGNSIINAANNIPGGLGDFMRAMLTVLNFIGAIIKFLPDFLAYQYVLFGVQPFTAVFLGPIEGYTAILTGLYLARVGRGSSIF